MWFGLLRLLRQPPCKVTQGDEDRNDLVLILGPTGGFIVGFIPAALLVGIAYEHNDRTLRIMGIFGATVLIYAFGVAWLSFSTGIALAEAVLLGVVPFLLGDALKGVAVYYIGERIE